MSFMIFQWLLAYGLYFFVLLCVGLGWHRGRLSGWRCSVSAGCARPFNRAPFVFSVHQYSGGCQGGVVGDGTCVGCVLTSCTLAVR